MRFDGVDYYVGKYDSEQIHDEHDRLVGEWMLRGRQAPPWPAKAAPGEMTIGMFVAHPFAVRWAGFRLQRDPTYC